MRRLGTLMLFLAALVATPSPLSAQSEIVVEGTLVDSKCFLDMGEKGESHGQMSACGSMCLRGGQPAGLVTADDAFHVLVASASALAPHVGHTVRVTGMVKNGALVVTKAEMNVNGSYTEIELPSMM